MRWVFASWITVLGVEVATPVSQCGTFWQGVVTATHLLTAIAALIVTVHRMAHPFPENKKKE